MRGYGAISPQFWTGSTGKQLRKSKDARILATHLITGSNANMLGLYYLPIPFIIHETGLTTKEVDAAFKFLEDEGFAYYHKETEFVYIPAMAPWQMGELKANDNKVKGVNREYASLPDNPFLGDFFDRHHEELFLTHRREWKGLARASQGLSKGLPRASEGLAEGLEGLGKDYGPGPGHVPGPGLGPDPEKKETQVPEKPQRRFGDNPQNLVDLWNEMVAPMGFQEAPKLNDTMSKKLKEALKWEPTREGWIDLFSEYRTSKFLHGENQYNFKMEFTQLFKKGHNDGIENYIKLRNGVFRDRASNGFSPRTQGNLEAAKRFLARMEQKALVEGDGGESDDGSQDVHQAPLALSGGEWGDGERRPDADLLRGPGGVYDGAGDGGDEVGEAEFEDLSEDRGAA